MFDFCDRYDTDYHTDVITSRLLMPYVLLSNMINYNITPAHGKGGGGSCLLLVTNNRRGSRLRLLSRLVE